ncbi:MAG: hypothetical protein IIX94_02730 [Clostridia bacterium]|nr:hypothetical protein [Clostridia bacterium]
MCNIAGYIGKKQAAPILLDMIGREEGFAAGYYTGLTVHDGTRLVTEKVMGGLDRLLLETPCRELVGTCGFIHSRSKSGGGPEWGQPFVSADGRSSFIANGWSGKFLTPEMKIKRCEAVASLEKDGYSFTSRSVGAIGDYPFLSDGTAIHSTDLKCQYITRLIDKGMDPASALNQTVTDMPSEAVSLLMREEHPDSIFITRVNFPMTIGIADDGDVYFATTRLAFPEDVSFREITFLPAAKTYEVTRGGYRVVCEPYLTERIEEITPELIERAIVLFEEKLKSLDGKPALAGDLIPSYKEVWQKDLVDQSEPLFYELCERLLKEDKIGITAIVDEGAAEGYTATRFGVYWKQK